MEPSVVELASLALSRAAQQHVNLKQKQATYSPWTFTRHLPKYRSITKRMNFLMQALEEEQVRASLSSKPIPDFRAGDVLEVRMLAPEAGRKEYIFKGLCIARYNKGLRSAFKIYNVFPESGGFVQHIPLHMPDLLGVRVIGRWPVRRQKLYHLMAKETSQFTFQDVPEPAVPEETSSTSKAGGKKGKAKAKKGK